MMAKTQHLLFNVAEHLTQGTPESTYSDGKHEFFVKGNRVVSCGKR